MLAHEAAALAAIDGVYGQEPITYVGPGIAVPLPLTVAWYDTPAPAFEGLGSTTRTTSCELLYADVPQKPSKAASTIARDGNSYRVVNVERADDLGRWIVNLELAATNP